MSLRIALTHLYAWPEVRRGGERYMHELAAALSDAGHRVHILSTALRARRDRILDVDVRYFRRRHYKLDRFFPRREPYHPDISAEVVFAAKSLSHLARRRIDVWHALGTADAAAAALLGRVRGTRSVYTDLGVPDRPYREGRSDRRLFSYAVRHLDRFICLSRAAGEPLQRDYGRAPIVLGGGVDLRTFRPVAARHPTPALLFPSALSEGRKNLRLVLEALPLLRARHPDLELWLSGPGDPAQALEAAPPAARAATIHVGVGELDDLIALYSRAWVTVLPSEFEAFGLVVLESLACGTPVVTLAEGAPAELMTPRTGATSAASAASLAEACERALALAADPGIAEACRAEAEPHDWRRGIVPRMESIYEDPPQGRR